jgi:UPF0755 protein
MRRFLISVGVLLALAALAVGAAAFYVNRWLDTPLPIKSEVGNRAEVSIETGTTPLAAARLWVDAGVQAPTRALYEWFRWSGASKKIRAGSYEAEGSISPRRLLEMMVQGEVSMEQVRIIEGWTLRQLRTELAKAPNLRPESAKMDEAQLMAAVGAPKGVAGEGRFFPDTYSYGKGVSDLAVLRRAYKMMQQRLDAAWAQRAPDTPLKSPDEALILASIVEKETGQASDRPQIAGVFANRLRIGMLLQTDPTVIYGMGEAFDGNLRRKDLQTDTPWNTYTRRGLPPTPIALPGLASLRAAVRPQATKALYFVARGDGSSAFSESLNEHNNAVNKYQRGGQ